MALSQDLRHGSDSAGRSIETAPRVVAVVLNWNGWADTNACLHALTRVEYANASILVVDNGSTDESVRRIRTAFPEIPIIETGRNLGFAGGVNAGIREALSGGAEYVWLVNNDATPEAGALIALVQKARSNARFAAIGSVLLYMDRPAVVQAWGGGRINRWLGRSSHATRSHHDTWFDYITAASVLLARSGLEEVGLFDEGFFLYWEDADLSVRLRNHGWKLGVAPEALVFHRENGSTRSRRAVDRFSTASGIRFLKKHSPLPWFSIPAFLMLRIAKRILRGNFSGVGDIVAGWSDYRRSPAGFITPP